MELSSLTAVSLSMDATAIKSARCAEFLANTVC